MTAAGRCLLNDQIVATPSQGQLGLHWLRGARGLHGTKEGCGEGECGACAVLLGEPTGAGSLHYRAVASCLLPVGELSGRHLVTIEGLNPVTGLSPVQQALVDASAPQCGFCFPGIVVSLTAFFLSSDDLSSPAALAALDGNLCRCTGYAVLRRAIEELCQVYEPRLAGKPDRVARLVEEGFVPATFARAPAQLAELVGTPPIAPASGQSVLIAGGTDLLVQQAEFFDNEPIAYLSRRPALRGIERSADHLRIGGGVTIEELGNDSAFCELVPEAPAIIARFGSILIRNRATVAGNLANASPIGDITLLLLALGAELELVSDNGRRVLPLSEFYRGYKKRDLHAGELIEAVRVPLSVTEQYVHFEKISQRHTLDIASVNSALRVSIEDGIVRNLTLAIGGVAAIPLLAHKTARCLEGRRLDAASVRDAGHVLDTEIAPIDDVRGSAAYKRALAQRLLIAHALHLAPTAVRYEELV